MNRRREPGPLVPSLLIALLFLIPSALNAAEIAQITIPRSTPADGIEMGLHRLPAVSPHADLVAFASFSAALVDNDTNNFPDIFLWSRSTGQVQLISTGTNGPENGASFDPSLSKDGKFIAFVSTASNLLPQPDINKVDDVFVANAATGEIELISVPLQPSGARISGTRFTAISEDGRYVAYGTTRTDVTPTATTAKNDHVLVRDRQNGETIWVSAGLETAISPARPIAIRESGAWFFLGTNVFRFDLATRDVKKFGVSLVEPSFSTDGSKIAMQIVSAKTNVVSWYDVASGNSNIVFTGSLNRSVRYDAISISDNGSVAFMAPASDDTNRTTDIYLAIPGADPSNPLWISSIPTPSDATLAASTPLISPDGARVYFKLTTVSKVDFTRRVELYVRDVNAAAPELIAGGSYFSKMIRTPNGPLVIGGSGDFAFAAASSENDLAMISYPASIPSNIPLKIGFVSSGWKLSFDKIPNLNPKVQTTDTLNPPAWIDLDGPLEDGGAEWIVNDPTSANQRFYRLQVTP